MRPSTIVTLVAVAALLSGCGDGEDRPRGVTAESSDDGAHGGHSGSASVSGSSASGSGSESASGSASHAHEEGPPPSPAFEPADADTVVAVDMTEYAFAFDRAELRGPKLYLEITNSGEIEHELVLFDADGTEVAAMPPLAPGASAPLTVAVGSGTYSARCLLVYGYDTHAQRGMEQDITISQS